jgi:hypothetical protein
MNEKHISAHTNSSVQQMQREGKVVAKKKGICLTLKCDCVQLEPLQRRIAVTEHLKLRRQRNRMVNRKKNVGLE